MDNEVVLCKGLTAVHSKNNYFKISVYPNPVNDESVIYFEKNLNKECKLELLDVTGKKVWEKIINEDKTLFRKGSINSGIYFLVVSDNEKQSQYKLLVE